MNAEKPKRLPGRPPKPPEERKGGNLTIRLRGGARKKLDQAVAASGRSLSEEIEFQVSRAFEWERMLGDELLELASLVHVAATNVTARKKRAWLNNQETRDEIVRNMANLFEAMRDGEIPAVTRAAHDEVASDERSVVTEAKDRDHVTPTGAVPVPAQGFSTLGEVIRQAVIAAIQETIPASQTRGALVDEPAARIGARERKQSKGSEKRMPFYIKRRAARPDTTRH
jgi:hypothetical protein